MNPNVPWVADSMSEYLKTKAISASGLITIYKQSPLHFKAKYIDELDVEDETPATTFGTLAHTAVLLKPEEFNARYAIAPCDDFRLKKYLDWKTSELGEGVIPVKPKDHERVLKILASLKDHPRASKLLSRGVTEVSYYFEKDGFKWKFRPDLMREKDAHIVDLKFVRDASYEAFQRAIANYRWDMKAAFYVDAFHHVYGYAPNGYSWLAIENKEPFAAAIYTAEPSLLEIGRADNSTAINVYKRCLESGQWSGYDEIKPMFMPYYMENRFDDSFLEDQA